MPAAGSARLGSARLGSARLGSARLGSARLGSARLGSARLGSARLGSARLGSARLGSAIITEFQAGIVTDSLTFMLDPPASRHPFPLIADARIFTAKRGPCQSQGAALSIARQAIASLLHALGQGLYQRRRCPGIEVLSIPVPTPPAVQVNLSVQVHVGIGLDSAADEDRRLLNVQRRAAAPGPPLPVPIRQGAVPRFQEIPPAPDAVPSIAVLSMLFRTRCTQPRSPVA